MFWSPRAGDPSSHRRYMGQCEDLVRGLLWNDPADTEEHLNEFGFGRNTKRGGGAQSFGHKVCLCSSEEGVKRGRTDPTGPQPPTGMNCVLGAGWVASDDRGWCVGEWQWFLCRKVP